MSGKEVKEKVLEELSKWQFEESVKGNVLTESHTQHKAIDLTEKFVREEYDGIALAHKLIVKQERQKVLDDVEKLDSGFLVDDMIINRRSFEKLKEAKG